MRYHRAQLESSLLTAVGEAAQLARAPKDNGRRRNMRYHREELELSVKTVVGAAQLAIAAQKAAKCLNQAVTNKNVKLVGSTVEAWGSVNSKR